MSEPPSKRQKLKTATACEPCRSRKIRCDGNKPSCQACLKRSQQCIYQATPDSKSANAYLDSLLNRLARLEQELHNARNTILQLSTAPPPTLDLPPHPHSNPTPTHPHSNIDPRLLPDYAASSSDQPPGDAALDVVPNRGHAFHDSSSAHGFTRQMYGTLQQDSPTTSEIPIDPALMRPSPSPSIPVDPALTRSPPSPSIPLDPALTRPSPSPSVPVDPALTRPSHPPPSIPYAPESFSLLPRELADRLMHLYWDRVHVLYPILHKPSFDKAYEDVWKPKSQHQHYHPASALGLGAAVGPSSLVFHCAFNAALALGMQFSNLPLADKERLSSECLTKSKNLLKLHLFDNGNMALVQTLLLLTQYFQSTNRPSQSWTSIGLACRLAQGLGLHIEKIRPAQHLDSDQREMRTRVWHACATLDIVVSMTLGRPAMLLGSKARSLPRPLDSGEHLTILTDKTRPSSIDFFTETVKLYRIVGRVLLNIYRVDDQLETSQLDSQQESNDKTTLELNDKLSKFAENLPKTLRWRQSTGDRQATDLLERQSRQSTGDRQATDLLERQSHVLHVSYLHARILLFRPSFLTFCRLNTSENNSNGTAESTRTLPEPLQTALELIDAIKEYSATEATGAWWCNLFYTRTAAMVVLLAGPCPSILHLLGEDAWQQAWTSCLEILTKNLPQYAPVKACLKTLTALRRNVLRQRSEAEAGAEAAVEAQERTKANGQDFDPLDFVETDLFTDFGFDYTQPLFDCGPC